jgi:hypothetical protein
MKDCDNSARKIHIGLQHSATIHHTSPNYTSTLHPAALHYTYRHVTSSHLHFTTLSFNFMHLHFLSFYFTSHHITRHSTDLIFKETKLVCRPTQLPFQWVPVPLHQGVKWLWCVADHLPTYNE